MRMMMIIQKYKDGKKLVFLQAINKEASKNNMQFNHVLTP